MPHNKVPEIHHKRPAHHAPAPKPVAAPKPVEKPVAKVEAPVVTPSKETWLEKYLGFFGLR